MPDNHPQQADRDSDTFFGPWLRRRRRELDLTQDELAQQVGCAADTVRKLEAGMRRPSRAMADRLAHCLVIPVEEQAAFLVAARAGHAPPDRTLPPIPTLSITDVPTIARRTGHLPAPMTSFIGRAWEVDTIGARLRTPEVRLVTLTGAGGVGKTRLALQIGSALHDTFPNGVWFVNLAPISDPALVLPTMAQALSVREQHGTPIVETLQTVLREQQLLVLLDNFEQVVVAAPELAALLAEVPKLKLLVTSREALHLYGEHVVVVAPLAVPDPTLALAAEQLAQYAAAQLFVARAQAAADHFRLTDANAPAVAAICARLDGLPLAIELAAAQISLFPPPALLTRLEQRLPLLTRGPRDVPARQQTIRNTIEWSYHLLDAGEQTLFARLGVFVGGCTLEAAEVVCNADHDLPVDVLDGLASLIDKSLLRQAEGREGEPRFTMLETIRAYALERLEGSGEETVLRRRHTMYYLALSIEAAQVDLAMQMGATGQGLAAEVDNLRAALRWAVVQREAEIAQRISAVLGSSAISLGHVHLSEARAWVEAALALGDTEDVSPAAGTARANALTFAGWVAGQMGDYDRAQAHFTALLVVQHLSDWAGTAGAQRGLGWVALQRSDLVEAQAWVEQSLALCREAHDLLGIAWSLYDLGHLAFVWGEGAQAEPLLAESLALFRDQGDDYGCHRALISLGHTARAQGQVARATAWYRESFTVRRLPTSYYAVETPSALEGLAAAVGAHGQAERAVRLFGAAETLRESADLPLSPVARADYERDLTTVRAQLDTTTFAASWAAGRALTLEQAIAEALDLI